LKPSWPRFSRCVLAVVAVLAYPQYSFGSGGSYCDDTYCRSFFMPDIIRSPLEVPFFRTQVPLYAYQDEAAALQDINLDEWVAYFNGAIARSALSSLLYKMSAAEVAALSASFSSPATTLTDESTALRAAFLSYRPRDRVVRSLEYLILAKGVEPIAMRQAADGWQDQPRAPAEPAIRDSIERAERQVPGADAFISQRYRFQVLRLLFYSGQYSAAQSYFERHRASFANENSPAYRSISLAAGAYYKDKKYGTANYLFSRVFDRFPPLKASSYLSFHPMEDADWHETLSLARNRREKEVLWQLLGIYANGLEAINKIYQLNPKSTLLPLLLVREVNIVEESWSSNRDLISNGSTNRQPRPDADVVGPRRLARLKAIADAGNAYKPYVWRLSVGHLFALSGDRRTAERYIGAAAAAARGISAVQTQARMSRLLARVNAMKAVDRTAEAYFAAEYQWLRRFADVPNQRTPFYERRVRANHLDEWTRRQLSELYFKAGDPVRALLLTDDPQSSMYRSVANIDAVLAFNRSASTSFDKWLVSSYQYSPQELHELRGLNVLYAGDLSTALAELRVAGKRAAERLPADPV
jgi:hypothetical protein